MTDGKKAVADYLRNIADKIEDGDVISSAKDFEALRRNASIMIGWIKERYGEC